MPQDLPNLNIDQLTVPQRLELISQLWDSLPESPENIPDWHWQELERRLADADANPGAGILWEQVREGLRKRP